MADLNTKPLGGLRIRYLMNHIGYWQSEDQTRVGERERKVFEEKKNFAGKVREISNMLVRIIVFNIIGFEAVIFVIFRIYKHFEILCTFLFIQIDSCQSSMRR